VQIGSAEVTLIGKVPAGKLALDGDILVETEDEVFADRRQLAANGVLSVTLKLDPSGKLLEPFGCAAVGIPLEEDELKTLPAQLKKLVLRSLQDLGDSERRNRPLIEKEIKKALRRWCKQHYQKDPLLLLAFA
jgi:ribonuclease J